MLRLNPRPTIIALLCLGFLVPSSSFAGEWMTISHANEGVTVECPEEWKSETSGDSLILESPEEREAIIISAFSRPGGTLSEFSDARFSVESDIYKQIGKPREFASRNSPGVILHSQGTYPGEGEETTRIMYCTCDSSVCVSATLYTSPETFSEQRSLYEKIFRSININPGN